MKRIKNIIKCILQLVATFIIVILALVGVHWCMYSFLKIDTTFILDEFSFEIVLNNIITAAKYVWVVIKAATICLIAMKIIDFIGEL